MRVLVTGGAGFIGSHLVDRLVEEGYEVVVVDNLSSGRWENVNPRAEFIRRDLKEPGWGVGLRADAVFHFAANPEVRVSTTEPRVHFEENVVATFNVLEWARVSGVRMVVFASSSTVYGDARVMPTPEDYPLEPVSVYGTAKAAGEVMCATYARLYGVRCLALRYANVVGPRLRHGALYDFLMKLRKKPEELEVLGDGTQKKSYLHVEEAVEATLRAWRKFEEVGEPYLALNVGNFDVASVLDIARAVAEAMGLSPQIKLRPATPDGRGWPGDVKYMLLSIKKIVELTGWRPRLNSLETVRRAAAELVSELG
ncbi:NAD-dependent epimerase/dehydratase family protein [Pyrobaculum neutrophilum]|uniref:NAD-dependent epimerase/dehydratase n=1 Tax=Pyrobaculum neutrophilum (strain DSM 2338 / JCM 9278 / NBRC 100436 / V24Sta) TaxID=444157 RepID=B1YCC3_PYRNV|nr:NAD-dependent epimerase/dehydratase family protein [Pyrobaculum neutrophilum]ACB39436.1 NAD-dependent epimerase/dehydratase [Pyrobaculum neutrophilum V24Sta]